MPRPMYAKSGGKWWQVYPTPPVVVAPVLTATGGDTQVVLTWTAATGTTVLSYEVEKDGVVENVGSVLTKTYTGLTNGQAYSFRVRAVVNYVSSPWSNTASATPAVPYNAATGGTVTDVPNYNGTGETWRVHTFSTPGGFAGAFSVSAAPKPFRILTVGGGGGGGALSSGRGGGGGGGGGVADVTVNLSAIAYDVVVGATGGLGANGGESYFATGSTKLASGGGGGTGHAGSTGSGTGRNGGTSGSPQSNIGGLNSGDSWSGGGGGGAGGPGGNAVASGAPGVGGPGLASTITGASVAYGGGAYGASQANAGSANAGVVIVAYRIG